MDIWKTINLRNAILSCLKLLNQSGAVILCYKMIVKELRFFFFFSKVLGNLSVAQNA